MLTVGVAPRNSLRVLRTLRSDSRGESVDEVRCAHRPQRLRASNVRVESSTSNIKAARNISLDTSDELRRGHRKTPCVALC